MIQALEILRYLNLGLSALCTILAIVDLRRVWGRLQPDTRLKRMSWVILLGVVFLGTIEAIATHSPPGFRQVLVSCALAYTVAAYLMPPHKQAFPE